VCTSRAPRVGEVHGSDFYFLPASLIKSFAENSDFVVLAVWNDWHAIDVGQIEELLDSNDLVFAEVFHTFGKTLKAKAAERKVPVSSVFLVPTNLETPAEQVVSIMRAKLDRRGTEDEKEREERSKEAPAEIANATHYTHILLNTAGEDDIDEWGEFGTRDGVSGTRSVKSLDDLGPAAKWLVQTFVGILDGLVPEGVHRDP
jgi:guanylate kinase